MDIITFTGINLILIIFLATRKLFPKCYYSRNDILVLEDLTQNYRHLKATESYTIDHYKLVLEHLAELHASSIAWEEKEQVNINESYKDVLIELHLSADNSWYMTGLRVGLTPPLISI